MTWAEPKQWDEIVAQSPGATGFHLRSWCQALVGHVPGYRARALLLPLRDGSRVLFPLQLRGGALRVGPLRRAVASLRNTFGGPIHPDRHLTAEDWQDVHAALDRAPVGRVDCFGNVLEPLGGGTQERTTHLLVLDALPEEARSAYHPRCRNAIRQAERAGVRVERLRTPDEVGQYVAIYQDSLARWGGSAGPPDPPELFFDLARRPGIELWGARAPDGRLAAGGVFLHSSVHCAYWHGAMADELKGLRPANLLIDRRIEDVRRRGLAVFDFGPTAPGLEGVVSFKRSFRPEERAFRRWRHVPRALRFWARRSRAQARAARSSS